MVIKIGFTRDFFDKDGNYIMPGLGPRVFNDMPGVEWQMLPEYLPEITPEQVAGFDMIMNWSPGWTKRSFENSDRLISIHRVGVGYDKIDLSAATKAGVMLCITPKSCTRPMALTVLTYLLAVSMHLRIKDKLTREGHWSERTKYYGVELTGKTLGLVGVGSIGHEVFKLAKPLEMKYVAHDPYISPEAVADVDAKMVDLDTVLAESDFLSINCPLTEETRGMIGERELKKMKRSAFLINTARGSIVDEGALIKALNEGWIKGAGLDVFEQEPVPVDNPLLRMDNVIVSPHFLCHTDEHFIKMADEWAEQVADILNGKIPDKLVNREVWDNQRLQAKLRRLK
ncbi:MAG: hydroxyacid dehydrogenase [Dehalococcoidales bacterium]